MQSHLRDLPPLLKGNARFCAGKRLYNKRLMRGRMCALSFI